MVWHKNTETHALLELFTVGTTCSKSSMKSRQIILH